MQIKSLDALDPTVKREHYTFDGFSIDTEVIERALKEDEEAPENVEYIPGRTHYYKEEKSIMRKINA